MMQMCEFMIVLAFLKERDARTLFFWLPLPKAQVSSAPGSETQVCLDSNAPLVAGASSALLLQHGFQHLRRYLPWAGRAWLRTHLITQKTFKRRWKWLQGTHEIRVTCNILHIIQDKYMQYKKMAADSYWHSFDISLLGISWNHLTQSESNPQKLHQTIATELFEYSTFEHEHIWGLPVRHMNDPDFFQKRIAKFISYADCLSPAEKRSQSRERAGCLKFWKLYDTILFNHL